MATDHQAHLAPKFPWEAIQKAGFDQISNHPSPPSRAILKAKHQFTT
jgi:hypothetical protein